MYVYTIYIYIDSITTHAPRPLLPGHARRRHAAGHHDVPPGQRSSKLYAYVI